MTTTTSHPLPLADWLQLVVDRTPHAVGYVRTYGAVPKFTLLFDDGIDCQFPYPGLDEPITLPESAVLLTLFQCWGIRAGLLLRNAFVQFGS